MGSGGGDDDDGNGVVSREGRRSAELRRRSNMLTTLDREDKFVYGSSTYLHEVRRSSALSYLSPVVAGRSSVLGISSTGAAADSLTGGRSSVLGISSAGVAAGSLTGGRSGLAQQQAVSGSLGSGSLGGLGSRLGTGSSSALLLGSIGGGIGETRTSSSPSYVRTSPNRIRFGGSEPYLSKYEAAAAAARPASGGVSFASSSYGGPSASSYGGVRSRRKYWY